MDNVKYYNESLAYDFEMFMPKKAKSDDERSNIVAMPKKVSKSRNRAAVKSMSVPVGAVLCAVLILAAFCGNIALRLRINEVNSQINEIKTSIAELESEKTSLEVEMERKISYSNLELEAVQLGMKKPDKSNVTYIRVNNVNAAKTSDGTFVSEQ